MRKSNTGNERQMRSYRDAIARKIAEYLVLMQVRLVGPLQRIDRSIPMKWKKALFLVFVTTCSAWCSFTFFRAVYPASKSPPAFPKSMDNKKSMHKKQ